MLPCATHTYTHTYMYTHTLYVCMYVLCVCMCMSVCVCVYNVLLELMGTWEQLDVNTITLNPIQTLQWPSLTTISSDRVAMISLPGMQGFLPIRENPFTEYTCMYHTGSHTYTHTCNIYKHTHRHTHTQAHTHAHTQAHTQSISK